MIFTVKLHSDLDEVKRVGGASGDDGSNASLNKTFETHVGSILSGTNNYTKSEN